MIIIKKKHSVGQRISGKVISRCDGLRNHSSQNNPVVPLTCDNNELASTMKEG